MLRAIWFPAVLSAGVAMAGTAVASPATVESGPAGADGVTASARAAAVAMAGSLSDAAAGEVQVRHRYRGFGWGYPRSGGFSIGFSTGYGWGYPRYGLGYGYGYPRYGYGYGLGFPSYGWGYPGYYRSGFSLSIYSAPRYFAAPAWGYSPAYYRRPAYYPGGWCTLGGTSGGTLSPATLYATTSAQSIPAPTPTVTRTAQLLPPPTRLGNTRTAQLLPPPTPVGQRVDLAAKYRYDGGPTDPVPMPAPDEETTPTRIDPAQEHPISVPTGRTATNRYPAYGD